jgi:hypothetical protein
VLEAKNPHLLIQFIKWASTVVKNVSAPSVGDTAGGSAIDVNSIPTASVDDDDIW